MTVGGVPERLPQSHALGENVELVGRSRHGMCRSKMILERFFLGFEIPQTKLNSFEN